jgi:hypothetical protein
MDIECAASEISKMYLDMYNNLNESLLDKVMVDYYNRHKNVSYEDRKLIWSRCVSKIKTIII